jgi:predicted membrane protein
MIAPIIDPRSRLILKLRRTRLYRKASFVVGMVSILFYIGQTSLSSTFEFYNYTQFATLILFISAGIAWHYWSKKEEIQLADIRKIEDSFDRVMESGISLDDHPEIDWRQHAIERAVEIRRKR